VEPHAEPAASDWYDRRSPGHGRPPGRKGRTEGSAFVNSSVSVLLSGTEVPRRLRERHTLSRSATDSSAPIVQGVPAGQPSRASHVIAGDRGRMPPGLPPGAARHPHAAGRQGKCPEGEHADQDGAAGWYDHELPAFDRSLWLSVRTMKQRAAEPSLRVRKSPCRYAVVVTQFVTHSTASCR
jgi:hypothetical protein